MGASTATTTTHTVEAQDAQRQSDFFWAYTEEPHRTRRQAIIKAHPEVCMSSPDTDARLYSFVIYQTSIRLTIVPL